MLSKDDRKRRSYFEDAIHKMLKPLNYSLRDLGEIVHDSTEVKYFFDDSGIEISDTIFFSGYIWDTIHHSRFEVFLRGTGENIPVLDFFESENPHTRESTALRTRISNIIHFYSEYIWDIDRYLEFEYPAGMECGYNVIVTEEFKEEFDKISSECIKEIQKLVLDRIMVYVTQNDT